MPREVIAKIVPIHAGRRAATEDNVIWGVEKSRKFIVKSAFELCSEEESVQNTLVEWKWNFI